MSATLTVEDLRRWEDHGALWRVVTAERARMTIQLCSCLGEPVELGVTDDPRVMTFVRARGGRSDGGELR